MRRRPRTAVRKCVPVSYLIARGTERDRKRAKIEKRDRKYGRETERDRNRKIERKKERERFPVAIHSRD